MVIPGNSSLTQLFWGIGEEINSKKRMSEQDRFWLGVHGIGDGYVFFIEPFVGRYQRRTATVTITERGYRLLRFTPSNTPGLAEASSLNRSAVVVSSSCVAYKLAARWVMQGLE